MNRLSSPQTRFTPMGVFLWGLIILVVATLIIMPFTGGKSVISLLHSNPTDTFMDFFNSIHDAAFDNPYTARGVIYPPLTYLYYRLCGMALPPIEPSTDAYTARYNALLWQSRRRHSGDNTASAAAAPLRRISGFRPMPEESPE